MPKMSIIMPVYNVNPLYLTTSINSITSQSLRDIEIIIVDDCSDVYTRDLLERISKSDSRIQLYRNLINKGVAYSLNKAIFYASGTYLVRMDADDIALNGRLEHQYRFMEEYSFLDFCSSDYNIINSSGRRLLRLPKHNTTDTIKAALIYSCRICHPTVVIRRSSIVDFLELYDNISKCEDYKLWIKMRMNGLNYGYDNTKTLLYRIHNKQISKQNLSVMKKEDILIIKEYLKYLGVKSDVKQTSSFVKYMRAQPVSTEEICQFNLVFESLLQSRVAEDNEKKIWQLRRKLIPIIRLYKKIYYKY